MCKTLSATFYRISQKTKNFAELLGNCPFDGGHEARALLRRWHRGANRSRAERGRAGGQWIIRGPLSLGVRGVPHVLGLCERDTREGIPGLGNRHVPCTHRCSGVILLLKASLEKSLNGTHNKKISFALPVLSS